MTPDEHARYLGGLVANFQSLEFILRAFLQALPTAPSFGLPRGTDIYSFPVGAELPLNEVTSYDALGDLVRRFNGEMKRCGLGGVDPSLVALRDALAHGRVSSDDPQNDLRLLKFSRPQRDRVRVEFNEVMTAEWFRKQQHRVVEAIGAVRRALAPSHDD